MTPWLQDSLTDDNQGRADGSVGTLRNTIVLTSPTGSSSSGTADAQKHRVVRLAKTVMSGMVAGFLQRRTSSQDDLVCGEPKVGNLAGAVLASCARTVNLIVEFLHVAGPLVLNFGNRTPLVQTSLKFGDRHGATFLPGISQGLVELILLQGRLAVECRHAPFIDSFELAATHLMNLSYVGGHLIANGADIVAELQDAAQAYKLKEMHLFGVDIGRAWRKVLLSKAPSHNITNKKEATKETSLGLIKGFFQNGLSLEIRTDQLRHSLGSPRHGRISVDMDKCLGMTT